MSIRMRYGVTREANSKFGEVATLLWSNADPTSAFSAQDVDLGQPATNFRYLRIVWQDSTSVDTEHIVDYELGSIDDYEGGTTHARLAFEYYASSYRYERSAYFTDDTYTELHFYTAMRVTTTSGNVGSSTSQCIPVEIYGVNVRTASAIDSGSGEHETYSGAYTVTPKANEQVVLATANKIMSMNVTVQEVPYSETSNNAGGYTAYIAREVE